MAFLDSLPRSADSERERPVVAAPTRSAESHIRHRATCFAASALIWITGACASTPPADWHGDSRRATPVAIESESLLKPSQLNDGIRAERSASSSDAAKGTRLDFARSILEHKAGTTLDVEQREGVAMAVTDAEVEHGLPVILSLAIIELESRFDPAAKGPAGSIGLMQLQPATARELATRHGFDWNNNHTLLDPAQNARIGLAYLAHLQRQFGTTEHALAAYNIGPGKLRRLLARRPLRRGPYLTKVYARVDALRAAYGD